MATNVWTDNVSDITLPAVLNYEKVLALVIKWLIFKKRFFESKVNAIMK